MILVHFGVTMVLGMNVALVICDLGSINSVGIHDELVLNALCGNRARIGQTF